MCPHLCLARDSTAREVDFCCLFELKDRRGPGRELLYLEIDNGWSQAGTAIHQAVFKLFFSDPLTSPSFPQELPFHLFFGCSTPLPTSLMLLRKSFLTAKLPVIKTEKPVPPRWPEAPQRCVCRTPCYRQHPKV